MKTMSHLLQCSLAIVAIVLSSSQGANAQFLKNLKNTVSQSVQQSASTHAANDASTATDTSINKSSRAIGGLFKKHKKNEKQNDQPASAAAPIVVASDGISNNATALATPEMSSYKNYDFVPGDKIIFQSNLAVDQTGSIPSQFTLSTGQLDVQNEDGENAIHIPTGSGADFSPRMTSTNYLPDQFTIEFDFKNEKAGLEHLKLRFGNGEDGNLSDINMAYDGISWTTGSVLPPQDLHVNYDYPNQWHHIAVAVNKNQGKIYVDQYRVLNVNNLSGKSPNLNFVIDGYENSYIKNIRIASGGIDIDKKVATDGKIVMHGILFDIDQATLKAESMGSINQIFQLLKKDASLKFEIDGHTDNTGDAAHNLMLSQQRADAVKTELVNMGIDGSRLTTKGFGDTKPLSDNTTPEGKANNRRVEFVKM